MTTARGRYEQKTRVVTFRVSLEDYDYLEGIKAKGGLSYADLIKLGAGIASEEMKSKLDKFSGLDAKIGDSESKLASLNLSIKQEEQKLSDSLEEERKRRLQELDIELEAFKLFDRRWTLEAVSHKLSIPQAAVQHYFEEWAKERNDKRAIEKDLLRECLKKHIRKLKNQRFFSALSPTGKKDLEELETQIDYCRHLLISSSKLNKESKEFLIAEYSSGVQLERSQKEK